MTISLAVFVLLYGSSVSFVEGLSATSGLGTRNTSGVVPLVSLNEQFDFDAWLTSMWGRDGLFSNMGKYDLENVESELCGYDKGGMDEIWRDYAVTHQKVRTELKAGEHRKILVWHCGPGEQCGGNGDQIKGLATAFYLAMATNRTFFISDWEHSSFKVLDLFEPRFVNWIVPANLDCDTKEEIDWHYGRSWQPVAEAKKFSKQCVYLRSSVAPNDFEVNEGSFQMTKVLQKSFEVAQYRRGCVFNFLFLGAPKLYELMAARMPFRFQEPYAALHLRFGDASMATGGVAGFDNRMPESPEVLKKALECVEQLKKHAYPENPTMPILVLTDSLVIKKIAADAHWVKAHTNVKGLVGTTHEEDGQLAAPRSSGYGQSEETDVRNAWIDQMALASASLFVRTKSGFSESAAEIGLISAEHVYEYKHGEYCKSLPFWQRR